MATTGLMIRWIARFFSAIVATIIFIIFIGEVAGAENLKPPNFTLAEVLLSLFFFITWAGLIVGWMRERLGGLMIVLGLVAFCLTEYIASGSFPGGLFFLYMLLPGVLYLVSDRLNRKPETGSGPVSNPADIATPDASRAG